MTMASKIHTLTKETVAPKTCIGLLHRGPYNQIGGTFKKFFESMNKTESNSCGAGTMEGIVLGLYLDNPECTAPESLRSYAALEMAKDAPTNGFPQEWEKVESAGGVAAVLTVDGSYSQLGEAWHSFGQRVSERGWKISKKPDHICQEVYVDMNCEDESKNVTKLIMFLEE